MMMKPLLLSLIVWSSSATSLRRLMYENPDVLAALDDIDVACMMGGATDVESCSMLEGANGDACVWCPIGGDFGGCVSSDIALVVNAAEIPHVQCGAIFTEEDGKFFDELQGCLVGGVSGTECIGAPGKCSWCVTDEPTFGLCFSQDFVDEVKGFDTPDVDPDQTWDATFTCTQDTSEETLMDVGALADLNCIEDGIPDDMFADVSAQCDDTLDSVGAGCVTASLFGFMDVCITETQKSVVDFIMDQLDQMGIDDPMSALGQFGGLGPQEDLGDFGDFGDFDDEELKLLDGFDGQDSAVLAEMVNEDYEDPIEDMETGK